MSIQRGQVISRHDVAPHILEIESPDIVFIRFVGDVHVSHCQRFDEIIMRHSTPSELYLLRDAQHGGVTLPESRAFLAHAKHIVRLRAVISYGASYHARTVVTLTNKAIRALKHHGPELAFVDTEEEARVWINEHRRKAVRSE